MDNLKYIWSNLVEMPDGSGRATCDIQQCSNTVACSGDSMKCPWSLSTTDTNDNH